MRSPQVWRRLKRGARHLVAEGVGRYGYELTPADRANGIPEGIELADFELVPKGRREPFSTAEYDVMPRGEFDTVRHNYYSPIPDLSLLPIDIWTRRSELGGIELDARASMGFIERELTPFIAELDIPAEHPGRPGVFFLHNTGFESVDAELLYSMIRFARPRQVIELGSGYTTLIINMAVRRNLEDGLRTQHVAYDPFPRQHVLGADAPVPTRLRATPATEVPVSVFTQLEADDVLFVDTTHTVKLGGDVNHIILDVLPYLKPGVLVHIHDIFLPWEYPRTWFEDMQYFWAEQYLLQAFLAFNDAFDIVIPAHALSRTFPDRLARAIPSFDSGVMPGSFWLKRNAGGEGK